MPHINATERAIGFKIVYFGPGMSGKTTNLVRIHRSLGQTYRGELVSIDTTDERTLFFDYFPVELGSIGGYAVRINLYTVPGQIHYEASRKLIVDGADGIVFVVDSQRERQQDNIESFRLMRDNLVEGRFPPPIFPWFYNTTNETVMTRLHLVRWSDSSNFRT